MRKELAHQYREELSRDPPSFFKSRQPLNPTEIEERTRNLADYDASLKRRKMGRLARILLAKTCAAADVSRECVDIGRESLAIVEEIRTALTILAEDVETIKLRQAEANAMTRRYLRIRRPPKNTSMRPSKSATA